MLLVASGLTTTKPNENEKTEQVKKRRQGGAEHSGDCAQRSYPPVLEAEPDQLCVPAKKSLTHLEGLQQLALCIPYVKRNWCNSFVHIAHSANIGALESY